ncbi:DNA-methyltransferase [Methylibium sp.]|uniref:DNA-methyltransferase n=1 Tax=Methylibium sp. TaxID=2067992 RepID=UPI003D13580D
MTERVVIGNATLYLGDCIETMYGGDMPLVHHVITDPPYEAEAHTKGRRLLGKQESGERTVEYGELDFAPMTEVVRDESTRMAVSLSQGWILTFCQAEAVERWRRAHEQAKATYKRAMVWIKPDGAPQFTGDRPGMGYESIVASWCGKGRSRWNGGGRHGVFSFPQRDNNHPKEHMTQKPLALMSELVGLFSNPGERILDPFMGSGTTGIAAVLAGRQFIGIEREPRYFGIACERISRALAQGQMFDPAPQLAEQLGLEPS